MFHENRTSITLIAINIGNRCTVAYVAHSMIRRNKLLIHRTITHRSANKSTYVDGLVADTKRRGYICSRLYRTRIIGSGCIPYFPWALRRDCDNSSLSIRGFHPENYFHGCNGDQFSMLKVLFRRAAPIFNRDARSSSCRTK